METERINLRTWINKLNGKVREYKNTKKPKEQYKQEIKDIINEINKLVEEL